MLVRIWSRSSVVRGVKTFSGQFVTATSRSSSDQVEIIARPTDVDSAGNLRPMIEAAK